MTTFPQEKRISFDKGIHVIFGGNHSGKTTIVNSIRYGVFGLSSSSLPEGVEKRYFSSRIQENIRNSLDINTECRLDNVKITTHRKVFSSINAEIEATISKETKNTFSMSQETVVREKEYYDRLRGIMGNIDEQQLDFVSNLMFADESRHYILWSKNLENFVTYFLTSPEIFKEYMTLETEIIKTDIELTKLKQERTQGVNKLQDNERLEKSFERTLKEFEKLDIDQVTEEIESLGNQLEECRTKVAEASNILSIKIKDRSDIVTKIAENKHEIDEIEEKSDDAKKELLKAYLNPQDSDQYHLGRYLYHKKQCPVCSADMSDEINSRLEKRKCPLCGHRDIVDYRSDAKTSDNQFSILTESKEKIVSLMHSTETNLTKIEGQIEETNMILGQEHAREVALLQRRAEFKSIEESLLRREIILDQLKKISMQKGVFEEAITEIDEKIENTNEKIEKTKQKQDRVRNDMELDAKTALTNVRQRFSNFFDIATNGEESAKLTEHLIPELNGRPVFHYDTVSQFERTVFDYAFRIALLSEFAVRTNTFPSLIIETPDEVTDESYIPHLAKAIFKYCSNLSIVVTTVNTDLMKHLLNNYKGEEKNRHFTDLVSKGTLTQKKFYEVSIKKYLSEI